MISSFPPGNFFVLRTNAQKPWAAVVGVIAATMNKATSAFYREVRRRTQKYLGGIEP
jgi:hypothetical protein